MAEKLGHSWTELIYFEALEKGLHGDEDES